MASETGRTDNKHYRRALDHCREEAFSGAEPFVDINHLTRVVPVQSPLHRLNLYELHNTRWNPKRRFDERLGAQVGTLQGIQDLESLFCGDDFDVNVLRRDYGVIGYLKGYRFENPFLGRAENGRIIGVGCDGADDESEANALAMAGGYEQGFFNRVAIETGIRLNCVGIPHTVTGYLAWVAGLAGSEDFRVKGEKVDIYLESGARIRQYEPEGTVDLLTMVRSGLIKRNKDDDYQAMVLSIIGEQTPTLYNIPEQPEIMPGSVPSCRLPKGSVQSYLSRLRGCNMKQR